MTTGDSGWNDGGSTGATNNDFAGGDFSTGGGEVGGHGDNACRKCGEGRLHDLTSPRNLPTNWRQRGTSLVTVLPAAAREAASTVVKKDTPRQTAPILASLQELVVLASSLATWPQTALTK